MLPYHDPAAAGRTRASDHAVRAVRVLAVLLFAAWVWRYMREPETILHGSILVFHEAGHVLFMPFGDFMMVLGGSLFQLMVPLFLIGYFVWRRDFFAACFAALYLAASLDNLARYIADARAGELPLLGGERFNHDWTFLLIEMERLDSDVAIGRFVHNCAVMVFWLSVPTALYLGWQNRPEAVEQQQEPQPAGLERARHPNVITSSWKER